MNKSKKIGDSLSTSYNNALDNIALLKQARETMITYVIHSEVVRCDDNLDADFRIFVYQMYNLLNDTISKIDEYIKRD